MTYAYVHPTFHRILLLTPCIQKACALLEGLEQGLDKSAIVRTSASPASHASLTSFRSRKRARRAQHRHRVDNGRFPFTIARKRRSLSDERAGRYEAVGRVEVFCRHCHCTYCSDIMALQHILALCPDKMAHFS